MGGKVHWYSAIIAMIPNDITTHSAFTLIIEQSYLQMPNNYSVLGIFIALVYCSCVLLLHAHLHVLSTYIKHAPKPLKYSNTLRCNLAVQVVRLLHKQDNIFHDQIALPAKKKIVYLTLAVFIKKSNPVLLCFTKTSVHLQIHTLSACRTKTVRPCRRG